AEQIAIIVAPTGLSTRPVACNPPSAVDPPSGERAGAGGCRNVRTASYGITPMAPGGGLLGSPGSSVGGRCHPSQKPESPLPEAGTVREREGGSGRSERAGRVPA